MATNRGKCLSESGCDGIMEAKHLDHQVRVGRKEITVPNVEVWVCNKCGAQVFPYESSEKIEAHKLYSGKFGVHVEPILHAQLAHRAEENHRSLDEEIASLLEKCLQETT